MQQDSGELIQIRNKHRILEQRNQDTGRQSHGGHCRHDSPHRPDQTLPNSISYKFEIMSHLLEEANLRIIGLTKANDAEDCKLAKL